MNQFYSEQSKFYIAIDCIIFGFDKEKLKLLLIKRNFEPNQGKWSLMGGFLKPEESLNQAAKRVLEKLTGMKDIFLEQLQSYGEMDRDPAGRVISVAYYALIDVQNYNEIENSQYTARWFDIDQKPALIFDHDQMTHDALERLKEKSSAYPIGFELLPDKFTLPQLQKLYEAVHQISFDKRNFRKKILSFNILRRLDEKDKEGSRKGAFLYEIDRDRYSNMLEEGHFQF